MNQIEDYLLNQNVLKEQRIKFIFRMRKISKKSNSKPSITSMARSHEMNDEYMREYDEILREHGEIIDMPVIQEPNQVRINSGIYGNGFHKYINGKLSKQWHDSPIDPEGVLCDASDLNILCMDLLGNNFVVGSADHALYEYNLAGKKTRTLYTKTYFI